MHTKYTLAAWCADHQTILWSVNLWLWIRGVFPDFLFAAKDMVKLFGPHLLRYAYTDRIISLLCSCHRVQTHFTICPLSIAGKSSLPGLPDFKFKVFCNQRCAFFMIGAISAVASSCLRTLSMHNGFNLKSMPSPLYLPWPLPLQCQYALHRKRPGNWEKWSFLPWLPTQTHNKSRCLQMHPVLELMCGMNTPTPAHSSKQISVWDPTSGHL